MGEEEKDVEVKQVGAGLMLVDPNPSGRNVLPAEDMFIYISLTAEERNRGVATIGENENEFEESRFGIIEFVSTEVKYNQAGEPQKNIMGDVKSYATTSYTNIGGIQNSLGSGLLEGFGITSINIKYNTSLIPQVDIDFTDVRGSGLFDVIEQDNRKSPYSIFFKMPYPIFTLTVKGYFGKPVSYCLNLVNWTSKFDAGTGNFNISANFLGFQQAFLADITIGDIIGTLNTEIGFKNLNELPLTVGTIKNGTSDGTQTIATPSLDDFVKQLSKLQIDLEELKIENTKYKELQILNTQEKKVEEILSFIGSPIPKANIDTYKDKTSAPPYLSQLNSPNTTNTNGIKSVNLTLGENYLSIRDLLFVKSTMMSELNLYMNDLNDIITDYVNFYGENKSSLSNNDNIAKGVLGGSATKNTEYWRFSENTDGENVNYDEFTLNFGSGAGQSGLSSPSELNNINNQIDFFIDFEISKKGQLTLLEFIDEIRREDSILTKNNPSEYDEANNNFDVSQIVINDYSKDTNNNEPGNLNSGFGNATPGIILDFRAIRMMVNDMLINIRKSKKKKEEKLVEELNNSLSERLGYKPTIGTVFQILCNNAQAFLMTIFDIGYSAERKNKKRQKALESAGVTSDLQLKEEFDFKSQTIYAFPSLFVKQDGGFVEKFIGSKEIFRPEDEDARTAFPEIKFIENLIEALLKEEKSLLGITKQVNKAKGSSSGNDTDNWIPINPIDCEKNPFYLLNVAQTKTAEGKDVLYEKFIKALVDRFVILKYYSTATGNFGTMSKYATWDGLWAKISFIDKESKDTIYQILNQFLKDNPLDLTDNTNKITKIVNERIKELNSVEYQQSNDEDTIYKIDNPKMSKLILGNSIKGKKIIRNKVNLTEEQNIQNVKDVFEKSVIDGSVSKYTEWRDYIANRNLSYTCWLEKQSKLLLKKAGEKGSLTFSLKSDITLIDGGINPADNPVPNTPIVTDWINLYDKKSEPVEGESDTEKPKYLTDSNLYTNNTSDLSKALLLLSTLPFKTWSETVEQEIPETGSLFFITPPIIYILPKYFLYYIGGTLWRNSLEIDPITWDDSVYKGAAIPNKKQYIKPLWYGQQTSLNSSLLELPVQTKNNLIDYFTKWVNDGSFSKFSKAVIEYSNDDLSIDEKFKKGINLTTLLKETEKLIVVTNETRSSDFDSVNFDTYLNKFKQSFNTEIKSSDNKTNTTESTDQTNNMEDIKQAAYNSIKNVYDRWVAGNTSKRELAFNACAKDNKDLFKYFRFVDRGFNDIGDKAIINLESVISISQNLTTNMYFYMSKLLRDSNFLFQILPNYVNYRDPEEVSTMFKPITNISDRNTSSGPTYLCIYAGGASQVLNIEEQNRYTFKNDGFNLDFPPSDILAPKKSEKRQARQQSRKEKKRLRREAKGKSVSNASEDNINLVGFRVSFGTENQTVFKSVSLNQQEHKDTAEYHKTLTDLIDKRGGTSRTYQGTDLYKMFRSRSYTCTVEALGCMNIQPMMYFQLDNVPFFDGAYMILNVTHNITPNHMTTSFTGVRQSKYITPVVDKMTTFLNIGLDDTLETEPILLQSSIRREINFNTGIPADKGSDENFNFDSLTESNLITMGISNASTNLSTNLKNTLKGFRIKSNSQVTMFLANAMTKSNNFSIDVLTWNNSDSDEGFGLYSQIDNRFGNRDFETTKDAYVFRPRGFIPIIGRDQYMRFSEDTKTPMTKLTGDTIDIKTSCEISAWRWTNYPYSGSYQNKGKIAEQQKDKARKEARMKVNQEKINLQLKAISPEERISRVTENDQLEKEINDINKKIEELSTQKDTRLKSEENYPPGGWANGGQAENFNHTVNSLNFKDGKDIEDSFENFAIVLNTLPVKGGGDKLIGQTVGGTKFKDKGVNLYKENKNSDLTIAPSTI